jgi:chemotaxis protein methyltransferase CheR
MTRLPEDAKLEKVSAFIAAHMGLHFPPSKWQNLEQAFSDAAMELGFVDLRACVDWFTSKTPSMELVEAMACNLHFANALSLLDRY